MPDRDPYEVWSVDRVAAHLKCSKRTVYRYVKQGRLPKPKRVGRRLKWLRGEIERAYESGQLEDKQA